MKPAVPKTVDEAQNDWYRLGPPTPFTVKKFCRLTKTPPKHAANAWNELQEKGMMLLDKKLNEAWIFKHFDKPFISQETTALPLMTIHDEANKLYDGLTAVQLEDVAELVRQGMTVQQATTELGLGEFSTNSIYSQIYDQANVPVESEDYKATFHRNKGADQIFGKEQSNTNRSKSRVRKRAYNNMSAEQYLKFIMED